MMQTMMEAMEGEVPGFKEVASKNSEEVINTFSEYLLNSGALSGIGSESANALVSSFVNTDAGGQLSTEAKGTAEKFINGFGDLDEESKKVWSQAWYGALEGLEGFEDLKDPAEDGADAFLESLKDALGVASPSKEVEEIFSYVWPGADKGLEEGKKSTLEKGKSIVTEFLENLDLGDKAKGIGSKIMNFFGIGVENEKKDG